MQLGSQRNCTLATCRENSSSLTRSSQTFKFDHWKLTDLQVRSLEAHRPYGMSNRKRSAHELSFSSIAKETALWRSARRIPVRSLKVRVSRVQFGIQVCSQKMRVYRPNSQWKSRSGSPGLHSTIRNSSLLAENEGLSPKLTVEIKVWRLWTF